MKIKVLMLAFQPSAVRIVNVPDNLIQANDPIESVLDLVFTYGQNERQHLPDVCSVSAGDVILFPDAGDMYLIKRVGFYKLTDAEYEDYLMTERINRLFHPLLDQDEVKIVGFWVMASVNGEIVKWGRNGNTVFPYEKIEEAEKQAKYVAEKRATTYIVTVFNNGQMKHEEIE